MDLLLASFRWVANTRDERERPTRKHDRFGGPIEDIGIFDQFRVIEWMFFRARAEISKARILISAQSMFEDIDEFIVRHPKKPRDFRQSGEQAPILMMGDGVDLEARVYGGPPAKSLAPLEPCT